MLDFKVLVAPIFTVGELNADDNHRCVKSAGFKLQEALYSSERRVAFIKFAFAFSLLISLKTVCNEWPIMFS